jgi:hypothetical protein
VFPRLDKDNFLLRLTRSILRSRNKPRACPIRSPRGGLVAEGIMAGAVKEAEEGEAVMVEAEDEGGSA